MSDRASDNEPGGDANKEPTPAYIRVQINRLLACSDQLVSGFLEGVPNLKPLTALDTLEKMVRTVAALEDQVRKMEARNGNSSGGTADGEPMVIGYTDIPTRDDV